MHGKHFTGDLLSISCSVVVVKRPTCTLLVSQKVYAREHYAIALYFLKNKTPYILQYTTPDRVFLKGKIQLNKKSMSVRLAVCILIFTMIGNFA